MTSAGNASLYFEDFVEGRTFTTAAVTVTESMIIDFALTYDPQPFHLDKAAAQTSIFKGLVASGFQVLGLSFRLFLSLGLIGDTNLGGYGLDDVRWTKPTRAGDTLRVTVSVEERRQSRSRPEMGTVRLLYVTRNQDGDEVQRFIANHLIRVRDVSLSV